MMKRFFWFVLGVASGVLLVSWSKKKANEVADKVADALDPENVVEVAAEGVVRIVRRLGELASAAGVALTSAWQKSDTEGEAVER
jgi:hypothetical protein